MAKGKKKKTEADPFILHIIPEHDTEPHSDVLTCPCGVTRPKANVAIHRPYDGRGLRHANGRLARGWMITSTRSLTV